MTSSDPDVVSVRTSHNWYIVPVMNVDGYEYSQNAVRPAHAFTGKIKNN